MSIRNIAAATALTVALSAGAASANGLTPFISKASGSTMSGIWKGSIAGTGITVANVVTGAAALWIGYHAVKQLGGVLDAFSQGEGVVN